MGIPHPLILSNIIGRWGAMFHMKHERLFAISWGLFHFHTSDTPTENHSRTHISRPLTTDKSHNQAIYEGRGVFTSTIENTLYNHPPLSNNRIVSYIYTNYHPPPTTINHNYKSFYKYHLPTQK